VKPRFPPQLSTPLIHPLSGETYALVRADALRQTPDELADLIAACNEPPIYEWLFRERLAGQPYDRARAAGFHVWSREGWRDGTHFVFALLSPCGRLAGMLDIKSTDLEEAEVGYWLRSAHSGLMSATLDALATLARQAGYRTLYARVRPGNRRSLAVLERAGWLPGRPDADGTHLRFDRQLVSA
jgi:RimJ/RimL family protein N-acetyltransferase